MSYPGLGADFYGPPRPNQTDQQYQTQMHPAIAVGGIAAITLVNPIIGLAAGAAWLLTRPTPQRSANRFSPEDIKGGH